MTDLAFTLTRIGFLIALWVLVLGVVAVLRKDIYGTMVTPRGRVTEAKRSGRVRREKTAPVSVPKSILVTGGPLTGTMLPLGNGPITIGRAPSSSLVIDDPYASSRHTVIENVDGDWIVSDQGSTNGTFVDEERLVAPMRLLPGVSVRIGQTTFELVK